LHVEDHTNRINIMSNIIQLIEDKQAYRVNIQTPGELTSLFVGAGYSMTFSLA